MFLKSNTNTLSGSDLESLEKAWDNLMDIATRGDLEAVSEIVMDDIVLNVDTEVFVGKAGYMGAAENLWHKVLPEGHFTSKNERIEVSNDGTLGYICGEHSFIKAEDGSVFLSVNHIYVWKKHEGKWKMAAIQVSTPKKQ